MRPSVHFPEIFPLVTFELQHPLVANILTSKRNTREEQNKVFFFLVTVLISMYTQMHQTNEAVSLYRTAVLSVQEVSAHWKDKKKLLVKHK